MVPRDTPNSNRLRPDALPEQLAWRLTGAGVSSTRPNRVAKKYELAEGEQVSGRIVRLPARGLPNGSRLFIATATASGEVEHIAIPATSKAGYSLLERKLKNAQVGDVISITHRGWRERRNGTGAYYRYVDVRWEPA